MLVVISGSGLEEELGCGVCIEELTARLGGIRVVIENSSMLLGSVNSTQEMLLERELTQSKVDYFSHHQL